MKRIVIDVESFYSTKGPSVTTQGIRNYTRDADVYILSIVSEDLEWCGTVEQCREQFGDALWTDPEAQFWAANSNFDQVLCEKYFPASARPWKCALDLGAFHQLPRSLAGLSKQVLGESVDKAVRTGMDGVDFWTLPEAEQQRVVDYCLEDSVKTSKIISTLPPMTTVEDECAAHTRLCNRRGIHIDTDLVDRDMTKLQKLRFDSFNAIPWHAGDKPLSYLALSRWCAAKGIPVPASTAKTDEDCDELMSAHPELKEVLTSMRRFRKANTMVEKCHSLLRRVSEGVLPMDLIYCGAPHTRRWSCRGFNVQNLDRDPLITSGGSFGDAAKMTWQDVSNALESDATKAAAQTVESVWTRNWLIPSPGNVFISLDYSQIEPRCLNWLVGNDGMMDCMRTGYSVYEAYALTNKGWKGSPGTLKKEFGIAAYTRIKNEVLGLGYGMGAGKYASYANVPPGEAATTVSAFRKTNKKIVDFWKSLDRLISAAAWDGETRALEIVMPTGDKLRHFSVTATSKAGPPNDDGSRSKTKRGFKSTTVKGDWSAGSVQNNLWGGVLTENVTQRMARDVMAEAVLRLEKAGLLVRFTAHDEIVLDVPEGDKEAAMESAREIMCATPDWADGLVLGVEGAFSSCYTK